MASRDNWCTLSMYHKFAGLTIIIRPKKIFFYRFNKILTSESAAFLIVLDKNECPLRFGKSVTEGQRLGIREETCHQPGKKERTTKKTVRRAAGMTLIESIGLRIGTKDYVRGRNSVLECKNCFWILKRGFMTASNELFCIFLSAYVFCY